jgi:cell growth-regulating nucleolar protein
MVFFVCEGCNETLKKNKVDAHAARCKNCWAVTCVDCNVVFKGDDFAAHTTCISEAEKYEGALYQVKSKKNPQEKWMDLIQSMKCPDVKVNQVLQRIAGYDNVPRKKAKFLNFIKNSIGFTGVEEHVFTLLETEFNKMKNMTEATPVAVEKRKNENEDSEATRNIKAKTKTSEESPGSLSALSSHVKEYLAKTTNNTESLSSEDKKWHKVLKKVVTNTQDHRMGKKALQKAATAQMNAKYPDADTSKSAFKCALKRAAFFKRDGDFIILST